MANIDSKISVHDRKYFSFSSPFFAHQRDYWAVAIIVPCENNKYLN